MAEDSNVILKRDNHPADLALKCYQLLQQELYVDVTLAAEGGSLKAHRLVLGSSSDYFEEVLSQLPPDSHAIIILDKILFSELKLLIEYIYNGKVTVSQEELPALMEAASGLKIRGLFNEAHQNCENAVINTTSEPDAANNDELLSQGTLESTISVLPSLTGSKVPLPALERAATSLQLNIGSGVMDQSGDNDGPFYTSDQNQQQDSFIILEQHSMENPTAAAPIDTFVSIPNASVSKEKGPQEEEEDPFGETGSAENGVLMDWGNTNYLGDNAEAHQLLANVEIVHPLNNTNQPPILIDLGVRVSPDALKTLKAEYRRLKAAKEQDAVGPSKRQTMEESSGIGTEVASEYDESADSSIHDADNQSPDYSTAGRNNEGEEEEEENTEYDAENEMEDATSSEGADSDSSDRVNITQQPRSTKRKRTEKRVASTSAEPTKGSFDDLEGEQTEETISTRRVLRSNLKRSGNIPLGSSGKRKETTLVEENSDSKEEQGADGGSMKDVDSTSDESSGDESSTSSSAGPSQPKKKATRPSGDTRPFKCSKCGRTYKRKADWKQHETKECGVEPQFSCPLCDVKFKQKSSVKLHLIKIHTVDSSQLATHGFVPKVRPELPFKCVKCNRSYRNNKSLVRHSKYECDGIPSLFCCPKCDFRGKRHGSLRNHLHFVHNVKSSQVDKLVAVAAPDARPVLPFKCGQCGKTYKTKDSLRKHLKYACLVDPSFSCTQCSYRATWQSQLTKHIIDAHGAGPSQPI